MLPWIIAGAVSVAVVILAAAAIVRVLSSVPDLEASDAEGRDDDWGWMSTADVR